MTILFLLTLLSACSMMTYTNQGKLSNTTQTYVMLRQITYVQRVIALSINQQAFLTV
jgi:hypothetical protein